MIRARQVRNVLIFLGVAAGVALFFFRIIPKQPEADGSDREAESAAPAAPVVLHTARPPSLRRSPLSKPVSLGSGFGRSELTGAEVARVPASPLDELDIDRRWDVNLDLRPPEPPSDLPSTPASDEVSPPDEAEDPAPQAEYDINHLEPQARVYAREALETMNAGNEKLKEGSRLARRGGREGEQGRELIREAAALLRESRDTLEMALRLVPRDTELIRMMRDIKANLYVCMKHGNY